MAAMIPQTSMPRQRNVLLIRVLLFCIGRGSVHAALNREGDVHAAQQMISSNGEPGNGDVAPPVTTLRGSVMHYATAEHDFFFILAEAERGCGIHRKASKSTLKVWYNSRQ